MNKAKLKTYAPQARKDFIAAVTARAHQLGISETNGQLDITPAEKTGDLVLIAGQAWPAKVYPQRERLIQRLHKDGFAHTLDAIAYTWFNRFAALRFMEIHDYLGHGHRVLSSREGGLPDILAHATELVGVLPGLKAQPVADMKLAGTQDGELYRLLLVAQCNALSAAMPFLFERIDDETELLLPDNLLRTDSVITQLVGAIPEEDWADIEIIGWLYQFYISEKKDQVIGKVVKSEDIPAATQLFTPNWIVKYMVQNSLGAQWLATYPDSPLKGQMEFYIEPAEQTDEVKAQLAVITPSQLNPEELTLIDPACGSGHILVEAYELFKAIYLERGYRLRDVPQLILEKNLFGLDIDDRAAQLAGFALLMKARADDRRFFERGVKLNVMALQNSSGFNAEELAKWVDLGGYGLKPGDLMELKRLFEHATTFGSLIQVPHELMEKLPALKQLSEATGNDLFAQEAVTRLGPLVQQAEFLAAPYDAVVANPPYMGGKFMSTEIKGFVKNNFPDAKGDLFTCFIDRGYLLASDLGHNAMVTMESWMFLSSYQTFRETVLQRHTLLNLAHLPYDGKRPTAMGINFGVAVVSARKCKISRYRGHYCCSRFYELSEDGIPLRFPTPNERLKTVAAEEFEKIPGSPIAYWVSDQVLSLYECKPLLGEVASARPGLSTTNNELFLRCWHEVSHTCIGFDHQSSESAEASGLTWFPYNKGGAFRKWFGNNDFIINWKNDGKEIKDFVVNNENDPRTTHWSRRIVSAEYYFRDSVSASAITSAANSYRYYPAGALFDVNFRSFFGSPNIDQMELLGFLNCNVVPLFVSALSPTMALNKQDLDRIPYVRTTAAFRNIGESLVQVARIDWNSYECSWDFQSLPILTASSDPTATLESSYTAWITQNRATIAEMKRLEEENNRLFIDAYGLQDELTPDVPIEQITLTVNPSYRYGGNLSEAEQWTRFRRVTMQELISYAIGCMMGRYRLDRPGLIYAHAGNERFWEIYEGAAEQVASDQWLVTSEEMAVASKNLTTSHLPLATTTEPLTTKPNPFPPDPDGILPITDELWFEDDAANRIREFILAVWGDGEVTSDQEVVASDQWLVTEKVASDQWLVTSEERAVANEKLTTSHSPLATNLQWLAESLGTKGNETPDETLRRYLASSFFKDHLQTYKKRPIYWLFSSGKQGAFQALVYLHRYHEGTLARLRAEYVVPLTGKMQSRIEMLEKDKDTSSSTAARNKIAKQIESLKKKHVELLAYDEKLRHYADRRISLDLDDGVKVNYGKFGDLLAEVKAITGGSNDD